MTREEIFTSLISRKKYLEEIISSCNAELKSAPEGRMVASRSHGVPQFHFYDSSSRKRTYLNDSTMIGKLASKDYYSQLLSIAQKELQHINQFLKYDSEVSVEDVYKQMPVLKQDLVEPVCMDDETYAQRWTSETFTALNLETSEEYTSDGTNKYRSKSESLIANELEKAGVPFRYEARLDLKGYGYVYPDFTVLNKRTREVFYHEHLGMLEDSDYLIKNLQKIHAYEKNGFIQGKQLILTYESENVHLDMGIIKQIINEFYV